MQLYEIALPDQPNPGSSILGNYGASRAEWLGLALVEAGGYTELGVRRGAWISDQTGETMIEPMHWYQIAATPEVFGKLLEHAFELFPDQEAFFYGVVGRAVIMPRHGRPGAA